MLVDVNQIESKSQNSILQMETYRQNCCKTSQVYSVSVSATLPFIYVENRGHVSVSFSCDPDMAWTLVSLR